MADFSPLILGCFQGFTPDMKVPLALLALSIAAVSFIVLKKATPSAKGKIGLIYLHLASLFFTPVMLFTNFGCGVGCSACYSDVSHLVAYSLPSTLLLAALAGFVIIPGFYMRNSINAPRWMRSFAGRHAKKNGMKKPRIFLLDGAFPRAFSTARSAIFVSAGLLDILSRKELEAVLLHEIHHLKSRASALRFSSLLMKLSPFTLFRAFGESGNEEALADRYAAKVQETKRHINSARAKINAFKF
ncbi:MAG: M48 family metalloprotease [Candidatus Aenigmarchaeota archaeon]|nr:M48 family metalloprotease [Candidatus Aenigmarchaeota archaeon]